MPFECPLYRRVARLDSRFDDGQWDEAKAEWALLSKEPSLDVTQARRLLVRYLDGIASEFDQATADAKKEQMSFYENSVI